MQTVVVGNSIVHTVYKSILPASTDQVVQIDGTSPPTERGTGKSLSTCRVAARQLKLQHSKNTPKLMVSLLCRTQKSKPHAARSLVL